MCFFDVSKCFDAISHEILFFKLGKYGIDNNELSWFKSYLSNRTQAVVNNNNNMSSFSQVNTGIPQGSVLGPVLFLVMVNDLPMHVENCNLYADNTMIEAVGKTIDEVVESLQIQNGQLCSWFRHNRLTVNASKSCSMIIGTRQRLKNISLSENIGITMNNEVILNKSNHVYLGLHIDNHLSFDIMIDHICTKLRSRLVSMLQRLNKFVPVSSLNHLYYAVVQLHIDYCLLIWGHTSNNNISRVQKFQNRVARITTQNFDFNTSGISLVKSLGWLNIKQRMQFLACMLMHKSIHYDAPYYLSDNVTFLSDINDSYTRQCESNTLHRIWKNIFLQKTFHVFASHIWNNLPIELKRIDNFYVVL